MAMQHPKAPQCVTYVVHNSEARPRGLWPYFNFCIDSITPPMRLLRVVCHASGRKNDLLAVRKEKRCAVLHDALAVVYNVPESILK